MTQRLLLLTHNFELAGGKWMGPNFFLSLFQSSFFQQRETEVHILSRSGTSQHTTQGPLHLHKVRSPSIYTEPFDTYGRIWSGQMRVSPAQDLRARLQDAYRVGWRALRFQPPVRLAHWTEPYFPLGNGVRLYRGLRGQRNLLTLFNYQRSYPAHDRLLRASLGGFQRIVTTTSALASHLAAMGVPRSRLMHIPLGVPLERFCPASPGEKEALRRHYGLPPEALVVLWFGPIIPPSRLEDVHFLLQAVPIVRRHVAQAHFLFAFKYGIPPALRADTEGVHFLDRYGDIREVMRLADVAAIPFTAAGSWHTFPLSFLEAQACGVPVITVDNASLREGIQDGESGLLVGRLEEFAFALAELCADKERLARLQSGAQRWVEERFSIERAAEAYWRLWFEEA